MKKIGLVGGISWASTLDYYRYINEGVNQKLGGLNFAECILYSLNFGDVQAKTWPNSFDLLLGACESLKKSNVDAIALCCNTAHLFAGKLQQQTGLPLIHIGEATGKAVSAAGYKKAALLGTSFTMEMDFYRSKLLEYGVETIIPKDAETREYMQHVIKNELGAGIINPETRANFLKIVHDLIDSGAECVIMGCTEIPLLLSQDDFDIPVFDTAKIHTNAIVQFAVS